MDRPFADKRPIGPFAQFGRQTEPTEEERMELLREEDEDTGGSERITGRNTARRNTGPPKTFTTSDLNFDGSGKCNIAIQILYEKTSSTSDRVQSGRSLSDLGDMTQYREEVIEAINSPAIKESHVVSAGFVDDASYDLTDDQISFVIKLNIPDIPIVTVKKIRRSGNSLSTDEFLENQYNLEPTTTSPNVVARGRI